VRYVAEDAQILVLACPLGGGERGRVAAKAVVQHQAEKAVAARKPGCG